MRVFVILTFQTALRDEPAEGAGQQAEEKTSRGHGTMWALFPGGFQVCIFFSIKRKFRGMIHSNISVIDHL
jgi:hypothetical protein